MAKSARQQRRSAIDDLRDMADAMEQAADLFEETLGDLDSAAENGVKRSGHNRTNEQLAEAAKVYGMLLPVGLRSVADAHLGIRGEHDESTCPICAGLSGERGWLTGLIRTTTRKEIRAALAEGDPEVQSMVDARAEEVIRADERRRLYEAGRLTGGEGPRRKDGPDV